MALPGAGPIPPEVGRCFEGRPGAYGSNLVSSGPYMIEGSNAVRIGSCGAIRPARGLSQTQLSLVRNPSYDRTTDSTAARENNPTDSSSCQTCKTVCSATTSPRSPRS